MGRSRLAFLASLFAALAMPAQAYAQNHETRPPRATFKGCSAHMRADVDRAAFQQSGVRFTPAQIERFQTRAGAAFRTAADRLCAAGLLPPNSLRRYTTLRLVPGAGASEATFFADPENVGRRVLLFQWAGFEDGVGVPTRPDIQMGLRCWFEPRLKGCSDREP
jgi:hypothetical protein